MWYLVPMPITAGAKKALRASFKKQVFNTRRKRAMHDAIKAVASAKTKADAEKTVTAAYKAIDKAAKRGVIKKNTASRKKARVARMLEKVGK